MNPHNPDDKLKSAKDKSAEADSVLPPANEKAAGEVPPPKPLTPEEQMALYEKDLKENDWGHQPC